TEEDTITFEKFFTVKHISNDPYIKDIKGYQTDHDTDYYLIPRVFYDTDAIDGKYYAIDYELDNKDFVGNPGMTFSYTMTTHCILKESNGTQTHQTAHGLKFSNSNPPPSGIFTYPLVKSTRPITFFLYWNMLNGNHD